MDTTKGISGMFSLELHQILLLTIPFVIVILLGMHITTILDSNTYQYWQMSSPLNHRFHYLLIHITFITYLDINVTLCEL